MKSKEPMNDMENGAEKEYLAADENKMEESLPDASAEEVDPIAKLESQLTQSKDQYLRLYSDFENYKKRVSRDRIELTKMAGSEIFLSILPIIDDFERAIKSIETTSDINAIKEGVQLVYSKLKSSTEAKGLIPMQTVGKNFDADFHDAITNIPAPSADLKGKVVDEVEKGYFLNDKVIRHAKVIVGK